MVTLVSVKVPLGSSSQRLVEIHIQELRHVLPPQTPFQKQQWEKLLIDYNSESIIDSNIRDELLAQSFKSGNKPAIRQSTF